VNDERRIDFRFPQPQRSGQKVITLENIHQAYGDKTVYRGMEFKAERGQRIVLVGPNGAGKSTLLKILAGVVVPQSGARTLGHNVKAGYYSQNRVEMLNPGHTVFEEALDTPQRVTEQFIRTLLGCFLFQGDDVFKPVSVLSGGEKSRLALVKLLLDPPNLLLMDEPTTHLDMASIDALAYALDQFQGTLVFISHDVYFIRALANHVVHVNAGRLTHYPGGYQYYLDKTKASSERAALTSTGLEAEQRQARSRGRKTQQEIVSRLEAEILQFETQLAELTAELERPATYEKPGRAAQVNREMVHVQERLAELNPVWEAEAGKLSAMA
jgi:ATP-binding cassette, subfamily F, member 3